MSGPIVLVICDGWGIRRKKEDNAVALANTPFFDSCKKKYPHANLDASGIAVGLPKGYQGNSEVGHLTIGSGRIIYQALMRIKSSIKDKTFFSNKAFSSVMNKVKRKKKTLHLMGLIQDQGVHAHQDHLLALLEMAKNKGVEKVVIHAFTDGRDTPPRSASKYLKVVDKKCKSLGVGSFGVIVGRYYAMDRDNRWIRTELAYDAITKGRGKTAQSWKDAINEAYESNQSDEFIKPRIIKGYKGIEEGDGIIFFNYRFDRARQLTKAFIEESFDQFHVEHPQITFVTMTEYYERMPCKVAFPPHVPKNTLGAVLAKNKIKQFRISETEKYAHVTFFLNGLEEKPNPLEERFMVPSPKVATYDLKPEMSADIVTDKLVGTIYKNQHEVIIANLVNCDMVGHSGKLDAVIKAVEKVDQCIEKIADVVLKTEGTLIITADHGNCEEMSGKYQTSHTINPVNFIIISNKQYTLKRKKGELKDLAPTILRMLKIKKPQEMSGRSMI